MSQSKREAIFRRGAEAFAQHFNWVLDEAAVDGPVYVCPLCVRAFPPEATSGPLPSLTIEHVPPRALGGIELCLTCQECNNGASALNRAAADLHMWDTALNGGPSGTVRGRLLLDDFQVGAEVEISADGFAIEVVPQTSSPVHYEGLSRAFQAREPGEDIVFKVRVRAPAARFEEVNGLRDAYLLAFAALGYRYILRPELEVVRQQIREPDQVHIELFRSATSGPVGPQRQILAIKHPVAGLMVDTDAGTYWLPPPEGSGDEVWTYLSGFDEDTITATGRLVPWPTRMEMLWDWNQWSWH